MQDIYFEIIPSIYKMSFADKIRIASVIQNKLSLNKSFEDKRVTHSYHTRNVLDDVTILMG